MKCSSFLLGVCVVVLSTAGEGRVQARDWPSLPRPPKIPNPIAPIHNGVNEAAKRAQQARDDLARDADRARREAEARAAQAAENARREAAQREEQLRMAAQRAAEAAARRAQEERDNLARQAQEARRQADRAAQDFDRWRVDRMNVPLNMAAEGTYWAMRDWVFARNQGRKAIAIQRGTFFHQVLQRFFGAELPVEQIAIVFDAEVPNGMDAITFGDRIFVKDSFDPNNPDQAILLGHEFTHVLQVRRMGGEKQFGRRYVRQSAGAVTDQLLRRGELNVTTLHDAVDLEKEANQMEERVRQFLVQGPPNATNQFAQRPIPVNPNRPNGNNSAVLGIEWEPVRYQDGTIGARVIGVPRADSAGARMGLEAGDIVFEIDGKRLRNGQDLDQARSNSVLRIINIRNSQQAMVRFPESPDGGPNAEQDFPKPPQPPTNDGRVPPRPNQARQTFVANNLGIEYERVPFDNGTFGARLTSPPATGSPAAQLQLEVGDVVFELDGQRFTSEQDVLGHFDQTSIRIINVRDRQIYAFQVFVPR